MNGHVLNHNSFAYSSPTNIYRTQAKDSQRISSRATPAIACNSSPNFHDFQLSGSNVYPSNTDSTNDFLSMVRETASTYFVNFGDKTLDKQKLIDVPKPHSPN